MSFIIAIDAGHGLSTAGKRVDKKLDSAQTREWVLNDRIARYQEEAAKQYEGVKTIRVDDPTGKKDVSLPARCKAANNAEADFYIANHHNAGIKLGTGGGIVAYCCDFDDEGRVYRDEIYKACIAAGGLRGNRSNPTPEKNFYVIKYTQMPAALIEYGFMDSKTDVPVIMSEEYAKKMGYATIEAIAKVSGLKKKETPKEEAPKKLTVSGKWDKATTTRLQQIFGTPVDGKVSNQHKKYAADNPGLTSGWEWQDKPNGKGSKLIKSMQKWAGMSILQRDGEIGPKTIKAIQKKLGTTIDGKVSKTSQMVKALQNWANTK